MSNGDESMSPAEFAKLMGAYPEPANNPLPAYGGYMDNSPANFAWVQNNDYFGAEEGDEPHLKNWWKHGHKTLHEKGDYRIIAVEDYDISTSVHFQEREDFDDLMELSHTYGMFTISLQKKVMGGWKTIDAVSGVVPHYGGMEEVALMELGIPNGIVDVETFEATQVGYEGSPVPGMGMETDDNPDVQWVTDPHDPDQHTIAVPLDWVNPNAPPPPEPINGGGGGGGGIGVHGAETYEDSWEKGVIRLAIDGGCFSDEYAEWVERQIDGPNATLNNPRYKKIIDKRWGLSAETFEAFQDNPEFKEQNHYGADGKNCGCGQDPCITYGADTDLTPTNHMNNSIGQVVPITNPMELPTNLIDTQAGGGPEGQITPDVFSAETRVIIEHDGDFDIYKGFSIYDENDNEGVIVSMSAEMNELTESDVDVSNRFGDTVGIISVEDKDGIEDIEDVDVMVSNEYGDVVDVVTLTDDYIPDDKDDYLESETLETVKNSPIAVIGGGLLGAAIIFKPEWFQPITSMISGAYKSVFKSDTQEMLENDPELVENPDTGDLDPAQYEELVVESTGLAVDVIPMSLDPSFMGSRFAALPTDRFVEYNDPGIGAHTDIAMNRDEIYLEPEMAMVQAAEEGNEVKEAQAPGQSPYMSVDGQEPKDFNYRVLHETQVVSLDPAVKPFIPQSMTGYTGNSNTPPSVMNKMFNIGVLGQTPLFVAGQDDMGSSHTGSRRATPDSLGIAGSVGGPLSEKVNANYTDGTTSMSLAQWAIENTVSQSSDTEAVVIDRSSGAMKRVRRV